MTYGTLYYDSLPLPRMLTIAATGALTTAR